MTICLRLSESYEEYDKNEVGAVDKVTRIERAVSKSDKQQSPPARFSYRIKTMLIMISIYSTEFKANSRGTMLAIRLSSEGYTFLTTRKVN